MNIISRGQWGARPWARGKVPARVADTKRTHFFVHYDGGNTVTRTGYAVPRAIERVHLNNGWTGVGYNFVVDQDGNIYEGRGWGLAGAHCPGFNASGWGVQVAVGGNQKPSDAALRAVVWLYEEACRKAKRTLLKRGHRDGKATACPGEILYAWVKRGMPSPGGASVTIPAVPVSNPTPVVDTRVHRPDRLPVLKPGENRGSGWNHLVQKALSLDVDGNLGPRSARAIKALQERHGLPQTGVVDQWTWIALVASGRASRQRDNTLRKGDSGPAVEVLQNLIGFRNPDGRFGPDTHNRLRAVQRWAGLKDDAVCGPATRAALARA